MAAPSTPPSPHRGHRPLSSRHHSASEASGVRYDGSNAGGDSANIHSRRKSTYTVTHGMTLEMRRGQRTKASSSASASSRPQTAGSSAAAELSPVAEQSGRKSSGRSKGGKSNLPARLLAVPRPHLDLLTPPTTPVRSGEDVADAEQSDEDDNDEMDSRVAVMPFDFSRIDYELDRLQTIGSGLWSTVYLAQPIVRSPRAPLSSSTLPTPPTTPSKPSSATPPCSLFAIKLPARKDSHAVFTSEAKILTHLSRSPVATNHIIPFHGLDPRNHSLVFSAALGGSLENLTHRLSMMTEVSRHLELRGLFPALARDLVEALAWLHGNMGIVHADVKPANVLLDIHTPEDIGRPVLRARLIDFSASFHVPTAEADADDSRNNNLPAGGGTWDFLAPEQLRIYHATPASRNASLPCPETDIWSLGITLLTLLVGGSPYTAGCGGGNSGAGGANLFRLREAIKTGDPLGFARMDPVVAKRMAACQDYVDFCRMALQKERERRVEGVVWVKALEGLEGG